MLSKLIRRFSSTKNSDFFWSDVSEGVRTAEYAVRGLVPTTATQMKKEIEDGSKSKFLLI